MNKSKMNYKHKNKKKGYPYIVYRLLFNDKVVYIGKTKRYTYNRDNETIKSVRWCEHIRLLTQNRHHNILLQLLYNELIKGVLNIKFEVVAFCKTEASATKRELKEIHKNNTLNSGGRSVLELKLIEDNFFNYFLSFF